jgi:hypothetical protein
MAALKSERDPTAGEAAFRQHCATCHQAHGIGFAVGTDPTSEFRRAEETIVHDILAPSDNIVAVHETYIVETNDGRVISGTQTCNLELTDSLFLVTLTQRKASPYRYPHFKRECPGEMLSGPMKDSAVSRPAAKKSIVGTAKSALSEFFYTTGPA